jgi:exodeoxyribonuclease VII small subunit
MPSPESDPAIDRARPRLGDLFSRLDEILRHLDRDDVELEQQMELYREACSHLGSARRILDETRAEIEILLTDAPTTESE